VLETVTTDFQRLLTSCHPFGGVFRTLVWVLVMTLLNCSEISTFVTVNIDRCCSVIPPVSFLIGLGNIIFFWFFVGLPRFTYLALKNLSSFAAALWLHSAVENNKDIVTTTCRYLNLVHDISVLHVVEILFVCSFIFVLSHRVFLKWGDWWKI